MLKDGEYPYDFYTHLVSNSVQMQFSLFWDQGLHPETLQLHPETKNSGLIIVNCIN